MSKAYLKPEACRLYVIEGCTLAEIASRLDVSERTLRTWSNQDNWGEQRRLHLQSRSSIAGELLEFTRTLMASVKDDLDQGKEVSQARLYGLIRLVGLVVPDTALTQAFNLQERADSEALPPPDSAKGPISREEIVTLIQNVLGG